ncbi:hypothetical protein [Neolewinella persica]|uniref:hypothetical protein n=1 Tax=Neolewinella persica TaxID=70998 RepID=UPI00036F5171|nr:hypothetical protein [Neolewinella persica]
MPNLKPFSGGLFLLILLLSLPVLQAQEFNAKNDILGKPFSAFVGLLPVEGLEYAPGLERDPFEATISNRVQKFPGVARVVAEKNLNRMRVTYGKNAQRILTKNESSHYMIRTVVEDGGILYRKNLDGSQGKEYMRYLDVRISIINLATSRVEFVTRLHADSRSKMKEAIAAHEKNPRTTIVTWALYEALSHAVGEQVSPFFLHPVPILKFVDGGKKYLDGVYVPSVGFGKDVPGKVEIFIVTQALNTEYGNFFEFKRVATGLLVKKTARNSRILYTIGWGKKKIEEEIAAGGTVYMCKDLDLLQ